MVLEHGELEPSERVRRAILAQFGTYRAFAGTLDPPMDPTQLASALKPSRRPEPETLDRWSRALGWEPVVLRQWYGYALTDDGAVPPAPVQVVINDKQYDPSQIVRFVRSHPDKDFQAQLDRQEQRRSPASFEWLCLRIFRAWTSNAELAMFALEPVEK